VSQISTTFSRADDEFEREMRVWEHGTERPSTVLLRRGPAGGGGSMVVVHFRFGDQLIRDIEVVAAPNRVVQPTNQSFVGVA
jgi:hypothetical protein